MKIKILIIGSKGFIGGNLFNYLNGNINYKVFGADIVEDNSLLNYYLLNKDQVSYDSIFKMNQFDFCVNCSGAADVNYSLINPFHDFRLNSFNVFAMLDSINKNNPTCSFINLSSAAVYGDVSQLPISEEHIKNPQSPYGWHKLYAENICKEFKVQFGIETCSLRIFSAFGEGLKKQLFWDFYNKTKFAGELELWGTGHETRDFIYIKDIINLIDLLIKDKSFPYEVINVANGDDISIRDVVFHFCEIIGYDFKKVFFNNKTREGNPLKWKADIQKMKSIGYNSKFTISEGLSNYNKWLQTLN